MAKSFKSIKGESTTKHIIFGTIIEYNRACYGAHAPTPPADLGNLTIFSKIFQ